MSKGRKNGCPVSIKDWLVEILDKDTDTWVRVYGLQSLTFTTGGDTEDGASDTDEWSEPYVTKRNGSLKLEAKQVVDEATGETDPGQELLTSYAQLTGCDADATVRFTDPYGHATMIDCICTNTEVQNDNSTIKRTWDLEQVGEAELLPYRQVTAVALKDGAANVTTLAMKVGDAPKLISVGFTPENASNRRYKVHNCKRSVVKVSNINETGFSLTAIGTGTSNVTVTSVNGGKTATVAVTVTEDGN